MNTMPTTENAVAWFNASSVTNCLDDEEFMTLE